MGRTIRFQQLEAFCAVMQYGTTTRAAQALKTTQPSVSRRLNELQHYSGLLLFDMDKGRLKPTAEGLMLYNTVKKYFNSLSQIDTLIDKMKKSGTGILNIGCTPTLASGLLPDIVYIFRKEYPGVFLNIQTASSHNLLSLLNQQLIDLMITSSLIDKQNVDCEMLDLTHAVCVLPLNHSLAEEKLINVRMLENHNILSLNDDDDITRKVEQQFLLSELCWQPLIETSSSITLCAMVCAQLGVAIVNPYVAKIFSGKLLIKPFHPAIIVPVQIAMAQGSSLSLLAREFTVLVKHQLSQQPG